MTAFPPTPFPRKGVTEVRPCGTPCYWLCPPWGGPAAGTLSSDDGGLL